MMSVLVMQIWKYVISWHGLFCASKKGGIGEVLCEQKRWDGEGFVRAKEVE